MKSGRIVGWTFLALHELVFVPFLVWLWVRLYQRRSFFALKKRKVQWILSYSALLIVYFGLLIPYRIVCFMSPKWRHSVRLWAPSLAVWVSTMTAALWLEVTRLWLLYYELQMSRATAKQQWAVLIDPRAKARAPSMTRPSTVETQVRQLTSRATDHSMSLPSIKMGIVSAQMTPAPMTPKSMSKSKSKSNSSNTHSLAAMFSSASDRMLLKRRSASGSQPLSSDCLKHVPCTEPLASGCASMSDSDSGADVSITAASENGDDVAQMDEATDGKQPDAVLKSESQRTKPMTAKMLSVIGEGEIKIPRTDGKITKKDLVKRYADAVKIESEIETGDESHAKTEIATKNEQSDSRSVARVHFVEVEENERGAMPESRDKSNDGLVLEVYGDASDSESLYDSNMLDDLEEEAEMESTPPATDEQNAEDGKKGQGKADALPRNNWYIQRLATFGNPRYCLRLALALTVTHMCVLSSCFLYAYLGNSNLITLVFAQFVAALGYGIIQIVTIALYFKTPKVNDYIHLKRELKYLALANAGGLLFTFTTFPLSKLFQLSLMGSSIVQYVVLDATFAAKFFVVHFWVVHLLEADGQLFHNEGHSRNHSLTALSFNVSSPRTRESAPKRIKVPTKELLQHILGDNDAFQLFMTHLMGEFAAECLLSVVEFVQFKRMVCGRFPAHICAEASTGGQLQTCPSYIGKVAFGHLHWPHCVPNSPIVQLLCSMPIGKTKDDCSTVATAARVCNALYAKYIAEDSLLEINISARSRQVLGQEFVELFDEEVVSEEQMTAWFHRLSHVWDGAITEMLVLMTRAVMRFTNTEAFDMLVAAKEPWLASVTKK